MMLITEGTTMENKYYDISIYLFSRDMLEIFQKVFNQGIDSHLEAFTKSKTETRGNRFYMSFDYSELPILVRRLRELETTEADQWADDIIESLKGGPYDLEAKNHD